ncbi:hypothetical protein [Arthrobacter ramosus]|uniref:Uncharacterized protein n=1 Tax=Arthrobacter ramosus TaxID=1672 RepID=A0ABV5Y5Q3_ARTRM|nr:hypothetical protein [Arthrobacter ramosus]
MTRRAAWLHHNGQPAGEASNVAKYAAAEAAHERIVERMRGSCCAQIADSRQRPADGSSPSLSSAAAAGEAAAWASGAFPSSRHRMPTITSAIPMIWTGVIDSR